MATSDPTLKRRQGPRRWRWTSEEYNRLAELGFFRDRRVELIEGEIVEMAPFNPPHAIAIELGTQVLPAVFGAGFRVRIQLPIDLGRRSQPEPDFLVLPGSPRDDRDHHPTTASLVIEVSDATLSFDRVKKAHLYAKAGIPEYWILNLIDRQLEVRRRPGRDPNRKHCWTYHELTVVPADGSIAPLAKPEAEIAVADLLP